MRLLRRRHRVSVRRFDRATGAWVNADDAQAADPVELTVTTFNIWFDEYHAEQRYRAITDLLRERRPDVIVLQEVTSTAREIFLEQPWIRDEYLSASAVGDHTGNYGLLTLSRVPIARATYSHLPTRQTRGFLETTLALDGAQQVVCCVHLDSGKSSARLRGWQLRRIFRSLRTAENAVVLGDFNMRDSENERIAAPFCDVWPALRPDEPGYTENTSINLMRFDARNKKRHVRFDRVLLKGNRWRAASIELLGTEPISPEMPRVFPSDHFGVECRLVAQR